MSLLSTLSRPVSVAAPGAWRIDAKSHDAMVVVWTGAVRHDAIAPADWLDRFASRFRELPSVGLIGAKRISVDRKLVSMGEFIVHPKGFHSLGEGLSADAYRFPEEVDAIAGGVVAIDRAMWDRHGGLDEAMGPLALLDLSLRARRAGGRCVAVPDVVVKDESVLTRRCAEDEHFVRRWGFDRLSPDLEVVRARHAGSGLLWNVRFWGAALPFEKYDQRPALHWKSYAEVEPFRQRADHFVKIIRNLMPRGLAVDLGCGDGLYAHLLAKQGVEVIGFDPEPSAIEQAIKATKDQAYPATRPRFERLAPGPLPMADGTANTVYMLDVIEHLPNPTAVLREAARLIVPGGHLIVSTPAWQFGGSSDPTYHVAEYTMPELERQIETVTSMKIFNRARITGIYRDIIAIARR